MELISAISTENNRLTLTAADGRNIVTAVSTAASANAATGRLNGMSNNTSTAAISLTSTAGSAAVTIAGPNSAYIGIGWASGLSANQGTGQTVSSIDLSTQTGSQSALSILDKAIDTITNSRANLGAYQNRFEAAISNLQTTSTNLQASRSRILDTDYAKETTNLAKAQIVQQAATAMLAQANQSSQSVLALLK